MPRIPSPIISTLYIAIRMFNSQSIHTRRICSAHCDVTYTPCRQRCLLQMCENYRQPAKSFARRCASAHKLQFNTITIFGPTDTQRTDGRTDRRADSEYLDLCICVMVWSPNHPYHTLVEQIVLVSRLLPWLPYSLLFLQQSLVTTFRVKIYYHHSFCHLLAAGCTKFVNCALVFVYA